MSIDVTLFNRGVAPDALPVSPFPRFYAARQSMLIEWWDAVPAMTIDEISRELSGSCNALLQIALERGGQQS